MRGQRKWLNWLGALLVFISILGVAGLVLTPASASGFPFSWKIRSNLSADYRYGETTASFGVFRLSIIGDMLRDMGMGTKEAFQKENLMKLVMEGSVPTATALDFEGNLPLTATATMTINPTTTKTPTPEPTDTKVPTRVPTKTPAKSGTATAAPVVDSEHPRIADPGTITPDPGTFASCSLTVSVTDVRITDAAPSSGINWVKMKYKVYGGGTIYAGYIFSAPLSKCSGGSTSSGGWDACYSGPSSGLTIRIYPGFSGQPDYTGSAYFDVEVWLLIEDNKAYSNSYSYGIYKLPSSCDDPVSLPSTETPTATSTVTAMPTGTPTATSTATGTATSMASPTPSDTPD